MSGFVGNPYERTPRDCAHGHLARSCRLCELEAEVDRLRRERDEAREWWGQSPMLNSCWHCGHYLVGLATACPQCRTQFDSLAPWEWPEAPLNPCECERCLAAARGDTDES